MGGNGAPQALSGPIPNGPAIGGLLPPRPEGRPTKLTPETRDKFCKGIRLGMPNNLAAKYAGIGYSTFRTWMSIAERDPNASPEYREFLEAVESAEAEYAATNLAIIAREARGKYDAAGNYQGGGSWQAAGWGLERRFPELFGRRVVDHRVNAKEALAELLGVSVEELPPV